MTALTQGRPTRTRESRFWKVPVAADAVIFQGALVMLDATGFAVPGAIAADYQIGGTAMEKVDNTGGSDGDLFVNLDINWALFEGDGTFDEGDIGNPVYALDDQTVSPDSDTAARSQAGILREIDGSQVWVDFATTL